MKLGEKGGTNWMRMLPRRVNAKSVLKQERSRLSGNLEHPKQPVQNIHTLERVQKGRV